MILDAQTMFSDSQALAATGVSTNVIDLGQARQYGIGEPVAIVITVESALGGSAGPTLQAALQTDDNSAFASPVVIAQSQALAPSQIPAGSRIVLNIPPDKLCERFLRLNYTLAGTAPTVTVSAHLVPLNFVQAENVHQSAFVIQ